MTIYLLCAAAVLINLPFGYFRAGYQRYSWQWMLAVHAPVPILIILRLIGHKGWVVVPLLIACAVVGQLAGGLIRGSQQRPAIAEDSNDK